MFQTTNQISMAFMGFLASHFWRPGTIPESLGLGGHARLLRVHGKCPKIIWLVVWNMNFILANHKYMINIWKYMVNIWIFMTFLILGISSSQLTNSIIFQRGRYTTNQLRMIHTGFSCDNRPIEALDDGLYHIWGKHFFQIFTALDLSGPTLVTPHAWSKKELKNDWDSSDIILWHLRRLNSEKFGYPMNPNDPSSTGAFATLRGHRGLPNFRSLTVEQPPCSLLSTGSFLGFRAGAMGSRLLLENSGVFPWMGVPLNGWFVMENPKIKWCKWVIDGVALF